MPVLRRGFQGDSPRYPGSIMSRDLHTTLLVKMYGELGLLFSLKPPIQAVVDLSRFKC